MNSAIILGKEFVNVTQKVWHCENVSAHTNAIIDTY